MFTNNRNNQKNSSRVPPQHDRLVKSFLDMGFDKSKIIKCLKEANYNPSTAMEMLISKNIQTQKNSKFSKKPFFAKKRFLKKKRGEVFNKFERTFEKNSGSGFRMGGSSFGSVSIGKKYQNGCEEPTNDFYISSRPNVTMYFDDKKEMRNFFEKFKLKKYLTNFMRRNYDFDLSLLYIEEDDLKLLIPNENDRKLFIQAVKIAFNKI